MAATVHLRELCLLFTKLLSHTSHIWSTPITSQKNGHLKIVSNCWRINRNKLYIKTQSLINEYKMTLFATLMRLPNAENVLHLYDALFYTPI